jgi:MYXO-CTERM domain-containing protein
MKLSKLTAAALVAFAMALPSQAAAFCGFYVSGADQDMFNNATQVVMMRQGTKTVLSMRNNYEGPPNAFAMVVPVPVVLEEENVKVLSDDLFKKVDALSAPRLVEYWEKDPCYVEMKKKYRRKSMAKMSAKPMKKAKRKDAELGVTVEAEFDVGEYNVVILSAKESNGLETWLKQEKYNIPEGAAPSMKPYIENGMYFFVAKVDPKKVTFKDGQAMLSPLRFHYDSKDFQLPVRLGLLNANGAQDLIVNILAPNQRYEVANFPNVTIPTNLIVEKATKQKFGEFYTALFDFTLETNPGAVVTEYSWQATKCDPCPDGSFGTSAGFGGALNAKDIMTLGGDVIGMASAQPGVKQPPMPRRKRRRRPIRRPSSMFNNFVLTRLHARYTKEQLKDDLVFKAAPPILGGRGTPTGLEGTLAEEGAVPGGFNNFQGRYIMLNPWEGEMTCENPVRGRWGGPWSNEKNQVVPAQDTAFAPRGKLQLANYVAKKDQPKLQDLPPATTPALDPEDEAGDSNTNTNGATNGSTNSATNGATNGATDEPQTEMKQEAKKNSCATAPVDTPAEAPLAALGLLGLLGLARRKR